MRFVKAFLVTAALLALAAAASAEHSGSINGQLTFNSWMSGSQFGGQGSATGSGTGSIRIDPDTNRARIQVDTRFLAGGDTSLWLVDAEGNGVRELAEDDEFEGGSFEGEIDLPESLVDDLLENPDRFRLQVRNGEFPQGAIHGALMFDGGSYRGTLSTAAVVGGSCTASGGGSFTADVVPNPSGSGSLFNYTFSPTGIGNSVSSIGLYSGIAGTSGDLEQQLSGSASLSGGSLSGSVQISDELAAEIARNPGGFYLSADTGTCAQGAVRAQLTSGGHELWFPAFATTTGYAGAQWESDLQFFNHSGAAAANVTAQFLGAGTSNFANGSLSADQTVNFNVPRRGTSVYRNGMNSLFGRSSGIGALRITSDQPVTALERIFNNDGQDGGSDAQPIMALTRSKDALTSGVLIVSPTPVGNETTRTNVGFFNPNDTTVTVNVTYADGNAQDGSETLPGRTFTLEAYQWMQLPLTGAGGLFTEVEAGTQADGGAVASFQASAPIFAYTSITHNSSHDTHVQFAVGDDGATAGLSEAEVAAIVSVANQAEIQEGTLAVSNSTNATVRAFAQQMVTEHTASQQQADALFTQLGITPADNGTTTYLRGLVQQHLDDLATRSGTSFNRAYMQDQVAMHRLVLQTIDQVLLPSADSAELRNFLQNMRAAVAAHLTEAQQILSSL